MNSKYRYTYRGKLDGRFNASKRISRHRKHSFILVLEFFIFFLLVGGLVHINKIIEDNNNKTIISPLVVETVEAAGIKAWTPPTTPAIEYGSYEHIFDVVCNSNYDWDCYTAMKIIKCESTYNQYALNYNTSNNTYDVGVWQINDVHGLSVADRLDINKSTAYAYKPWLKTLFLPWVCYNKIK